MCKVQCPDLAQLYLIARAPDATGNSSKSVDLASTPLGMNELKYLIINRKYQQN